MKLRNITIIAIVILLFLMGIAINTYVYKPIDKSLECTKPNENDNLNNKKTDETIKFAVLGDIHEDNDNFQKAIEDLYSINPNMDALVLNGDTVDQGIEEHYADIEKIISDNKQLLPEKIIKNIGNHEFYDYNIPINSPEEVQTFINRYLKFSGEEKVYHDVWINNYHFISLGSEDGNSETLDPLMAYISKEQQNWLKMKLAEKYQKGRPIFVFLHQPLNNETLELLRPDQNKNITEILSKYPEVILFTSHTHYDLTSNSIILNQPFATIETGAVYYTVIPDENKAGGIRIEAYIKGLYVEVNGNLVTIKGRDIKEKQWIFIKEILGK